MSRGLQEPGLLNSCLNLDIGLTRLDARILLPLMLCVGAAAALGMWTRMSADELVEGSGLIVIGQLLASDVKGSFGEIRIDEVLKGDPVKSVTLGGRPEPMRLMHSAMLTYRVGQKGLWFLRSAPGAATPSYLADHPQRFELDEKKITSWKERLQSRRRPVSP